MECLSAQRIVGLDVLHGSPAVGPSFEFTYDPAGRLESRHATPSNWLLSYSYHPNGQTKRIDMERQTGNPMGPPTEGVAYDLTYDTRRFLTTVRREDPGFFGPGNWENFNYEHDNLGRLRRATLGGIVIGGPYFFDQRFDYSPTDDWNIWKITNNANPPVVYGYDDHDRIVLPSGTSYDARGNFVTDGTRILGWDLRNRLTTAITVAGGTQYAYDPFGRLIAHRPSSGPVAPATLHLWDEWSQVGEQVDGSAQRALSLAPGPGGTLGHKKPAEGFVEYARDQQASRVAPTSGEPTFKPFGEIFSGALDSPIGFQGQEWRAEAGLYYMRHRWYDPVSGRWLSRDPMVQSAVSNYDFVRGNPVHNWDPMGLTLRPVNLPGVGNTYLDDSMIPIVSQFITEAAVRGVALEFNSVYRSQADQDRERRVQEDRRRRGLPYNPVAEFSLHQCGQAVDTNYRYLPNDAARTAVREAAAAAGLDWGGTFGDPPHFFIDPGGNREALIEQANREYDELQRQQGGAQP